MSTLFRFVEKKFLVLVTTETVDFSPFDLAGNSGLRTLPKESIKGPLLRAAEPG
jgi:hypothetical protein